MRKLILASVIAIVSAATLATPANARVFLGGSYFGFGPWGDFYDSNGPYPFYGPYWGGPYYDDGPRYYGDYDGGYIVRTPHRYYAYRPDRRCHLESVKHWRHHHRVVERVRVCG